MFYGKFLNYEKMKVFQKKWKNQGVFLNKGNFN